MTVMKLRLCRLMREDRESSNLKIQSAKMKNNNP